MNPIIKKHYLIDEWFPFRYSLSLKTGCRYGCKYCPGKKTEVILPKFNEKLFEKSLAQLPKAQLIGMGGGIGELFSPGQEQLSFQILSHVLKVGHIAVITTKGMVSASMLQKLSPYKEKIIFLISFTSLDDSTSELIEEGVPVPSERLLTIQQIKQYGFKLGLLFLPLIPDLNTGEIERKLASQLIGRIQPTFVLAKTGSLETYVQLKGFAGNKDFNHDEYQALTEKIEEEWDKMVIQSGAKYLFPREWYWEHLSLKDRATVLLAQHYRMLLREGKERKAFLRAAYEINKLPEKDFSSLIETQRLMKIRGIGPFVEKILYNALQLNDFKLLGEEGIKK